MSKVATIFPGQGAQRVGMGKDVADASSVAADLFAEANEVIGFDLAALCFDGPADRLEATDIQQPAIFATSVAIHRAWKDAAGSDAPTPKAAAGLSLGEYTALHIAGAMTFPDALKLVTLRGRLMQEAAEASDGGMVSIMGLDEPAVLTICQEASTDGQAIAPANFNCPGQIVISGHAAACSRAVALIEPAGGRATPLKVAGAFHSPLMQPAADQLHDALAGTKIATPTFPVVANVDAEYHTSADSIRDALYRQVASPVRWQASVERLIDDGVDTFVELGPGRVLTGLMRRINRSVKAVNVSTADGVKDTVPT